MLFSVIGHKVRIANCKLRIVMIANLLNREIFRRSPMGKILNSLSACLLVPVLLALSVIVSSNRTVAQAPVQTPPASTPTNAPQPQPPVPLNAPAELTNIIAQIDAAANQRNINEVLKFYSPNFTHSDGLTRQSMTQALTALWKSYPQLKYQTQLLSWQPQGKAIIAETVTKITGTQPQAVGNTLLDATIRSKQRYENGQIVQQEILSEQSQIKTGDKPPTVEVKLPQQVKPGQQYNFDAVVREPLGDDYLLGAALEEPIRPDNFANPARVDLELLSSGGLFKIGRAPIKPDRYWVSAVLIRGDGMTLVTQRLNVVGKNPPAAQKP
ncbi:hypothetical protein C7Y66_24255 [Chroococcidiopsis sp. CCALA 051]|uniref:hypothetical protein n=1 Tax=Chroococcidiopsis sp. CCALA 051 TaxID=869949 RepID=UPI000D0CE21F|nr:hypothetical protein C7Y66_24255 [Chroococcidiopsis sp. CCALA 051]